MPHLVFVELDDAWSQRKPNVLTVASWIQITLFIICAHTLLTFLRIGSEANSTVRSLIGE